MKLFLLGCCAKTLASIGQIGCITSLNNKFKSIISLWKADTLIELKLTPLLMEPITLPSLNQFLEQKSLKMCQLIPTHGEGVERY